MVHSPQSTVHRIKIVAGELPFANNKGKWNYFLITRYSSLASVF